jgi:signal peptidase I
VLRRILASRALFGVLVVVAVANVAIFAVERWYALPMQVPSVSMEPLLQAGDRILVRRAHESPDELADRIQRGDVIVFRSPDGDTLLVKRVIGLPGERIEALDGRIVIDELEMLDEPWLPAGEAESGSDAADSVDIERTDLADDELFVLGDNRDRSIDSREFGPIALDDVVGDVQLRLWPTDRFGTVNGT